ncbi:TolC family protein [Olivibacter sitiensis]|uniref:TolC family protein n=1 Tax=Olivibacter sitiensis TaxID=376470 RepID=UPI00041E86DE|nr:TolC family protein [Olivibacter sitiensis]
MRTTLFFAFLFALATHQGYAQTNALNQYIEEGLRNNLVLRQKNISLDKALLALKSAKSNYLPSVNFQTTYSTATGGRSIELPLGDLMNPVYATLNQLTNSQAFPMLDNESINFLPRNYYDARIRTTVPLINTDIGYNKKINEQQVVLSELDLDTYQRELVKEIKLAYYQYLSAQQAVSVYRSSLELAEESNRVNERLLESGKGLPAYVLRSQSEMEQVKAQISQAEQQQHSAQLYFNSLLNKGGDDLIDTAVDIDGELLKSTALINERLDTAKREEIQSLKQLVEINNTVLQMNKGFYIPKLSGFLDIGTQAEQMRFNGQSRYMMVGLQFDLPIYNGNRNRLKIRQAALDVDNALLRKDEVEQQLSMSHKIARDHLQTSWQVYQSSLKQLEAASSYQRLIERGYKAGSNTYIETIDARNQLTMARLSAQINKYNVLQAAASLEREMASYPLK